MGVQVGKEAPAEGAKWLSVKQLFERYTISEQLAYKMMKNGTLAWSKIGRKRVVLASSVEALVAAKFVPATATV